MSRCLSGSVRRGSRGSALFPTVHNPRKTTNASFSASSALFSSMCPWTFPRLLFGCNPRLPLNVYMWIGIGIGIGIVIARADLTWPSRSSRVEGLLFLTTASRAPPTSVIVHTGEV
jgi:hypothetical protein